jgi:hypothetical protein
MTQAICGMPCCDIVAWLKKIRPKCSRSGKTVVLHRQERAARVDEVDARQPVVQRDLLRAQVLLDRHGVVRAALDRRVVGDDDARAGRCTTPTPVTIPAPGAAPS